MPDLTARIAVIGGTGLYELMSGAHEVRLDTPYGPPSAPVTVGNIAGKSVAFIPRHGYGHHLPPHRIPYRANCWALKNLGVERIIAPSACGSLRADVHPGDFVVTDQFIDRTWGREDTYFHGPRVVHVSSAEPYCPQMRALAASQIADLGIKCHAQGTCVVIQGPRFTSRAESALYTRMGCDIINMTQYPEVILAREQEICYVNIALVTDYDAGVVASEGYSAVTAVDVVKLLNENNERVKLVIRSMIENMPAMRECSCGNALADSSL